MTAAQYIYRAYLAQILGQPIDGQNTDFFDVDDDENDSDYDENDDSEDDNTSDGDDEEDGGTWREVDGEESRVALISAVENYARHSDDNDDYSEEEEADRGD